MDFAHNVDIGGNIRLYNKLEVKQYKKDGHCWQKRKGNDAHVREDHVKLTVDGPNHLYVFATHAHSSRINVRKKIWTCDFKGIDISSKDIPIAGYCNTVCARALPRYGSSKNADAEHNR